MTESRFLKHTSCPRCGSRDNLAIYEGGSGWCFGCGYFQKPKGSPYAFERETNETTKRPLSWNKEADFYKKSEPASEEIMAWLNSYGVPLSEIEGRGGKATGNCLSFSFKGEVSGKNDILARKVSSDIILRQTRIFPSSSEREQNPKQTRRFYTEGKVDNCLPIYYSKNPFERDRRLIVVEDCISAIKIARFNDCMPCLSSDLSRDKLRRLNRLYGAFLVWLDSDMYPKAQRIVQRLQLLGAEASVLWTEHDPKVYTNEEIQKYLT